MNLKTDLKNTSSEKKTRRKNHKALAFIIVIGLFMVSVTAIYLYAGETDTVYGAGVNDAFDMYAADSVKETCSTEDIASAQGNDRTVVELILGKLEAADAAGEKAAEGVRIAFAESVKAYNEAVETYNTEAGHYNDFAGLLDTYGLVSRKAGIPVLESCSESYEEFLASGREPSWLSESVAQMMRDTDRVKEMTLKSYSQALNLIVDSYNAAAAEFNTKVQDVSVDFISGMHIQFLTKGSVYVGKNWTYEMAVEKLNELMDDYGILSEELRIVRSITCPSDEWVSERLKTVTDVTYTAAVSEDNDPNCLLGRQGGYTGCVYFNVKAIQMSSVKGSGLVDKGTDAGGAVEIFATKEDALNRCDYLSQFDNTLLYSGSYAVIGTMVVRTSYRLTNEEQIGITGAIVEAFCGE